MARLPLLLGAALLACGCANSGMGSAVRTDVSLRMASVQSPISTCYEAALAKNRKLRGHMVLSFHAAAGTGKFTDVRVVENELPDPGLEQCVVAQVSTLTLAQPQKSAVSVTYPLHFTPLDAPQ